MAAEHHKVPIIRIPEIRKHPNADTLGLVAIDGYQVVVKLDTFKEGDLVVYIHPDSVVPQTEPFRFIWEPHFDPYGADGSVPEKKRRITVRRFRKEWSEGLLLPITDFPLELVWVSVGDDVAAALGITHWSPPEPGETQYGGGPAKSPWPRSLKGWFFFGLHKFLRLFGVDRHGVTGGDNARGPRNSPPTYDVEAFKNHTAALECGEPVRITEKIHGSNARFCYDGKMHAGSRKLWKSPNSKCIWRAALEADPKIERWCRTHPGYTLYGEVTPTQKTRSGGDFHYGANEPQFFVFDILTPQNTWATNQEELLEGSGLKHAPELYRGPFDEIAARKLADGKSTLADHIREGVVVRPLAERRVLGLGRVQLKIVSNTFLEQA